jgi:hypothetical protein
MSNYARFTCFLALSACALSAQVIPSTVQTTGMIGVADAQTAQLNLLNPGIQPPAVGVVCTAAVTFIDGNGVVVKTGTLTVPPGQSRSLAIRSDMDLNVVAAGDRREVRAVISIPGILPPTPTPTATVVEPACKLVPTLEILDTVSGRTLVTLGHVVDVPAVQ